MWLWFWSMSTIQLACNSRTKSFLLAYLIENNRWSCIITNNNLVWIIDGGILPGHANYLARYFLRRWTKKNALFQIKARSPLCWFPCGSHNGQRSIELVPEACLVRRDLSSLFDLHQLEAAMNKIIDCGPSLPRHHTIQSWECWSTIGKMN